MMGLLTYESARFSWIRMHYLSPVLKIKLFLPGTSGEDLNVTPQRRLGDLSDFSQSQIGYEVIL